MSQAESVTGSGLRPAYAATRAHLGLVAVLVALAGIGWWWTVVEMRGMDNGPWTALGTFGWFVGVWVVMMAAMMLPSVAPTVALYSKMARSSVRPLVFAAGYLLVWGGVGALAYAAARVVPGDAFTWGRGGRRARTPAGSPADCGSARGTRS